MYSHDQVVIGRREHFSGPDFAGLHIAFGKKHVAVDVGGLSGVTTCENPFMFFAGSFDQHLQDLSFFLPVVGSSDRALHGHEFSKSTIAFSWRDFVRQVERGSVFFVGIAKDTQMIEACPLNERYELVEILFRFTRKPNDECGAQAGMRGSLSNSFHNGPQSSLAMTAPHCF